METTIKLHSCSSELSIWILFANRKVMRFGETYLGKVYNKILGKCRTNGSILVGKLLVGSSSQQSSIERHKNILQSGITN